MKIFLIRVALVVACIVAVHYLILACLHSPLPAEYWLREFIIAKKHQADAMPSPKIIFSGGSTTLFGIDAAEVQKELGRPAINFGLHAGMRLEDHLALAREVAKPGDVVVLTLEPAYYDLYTETWTTWALRNALAWNRESLNHLSPMQRARVYVDSSDPMISVDLVEAAFEAKLSPRVVAPRSESLQPAPQVVERYLSTMGTSHDFKYALSNLDANGDLLNARSGESLFTGDPWPLRRPDHVSSFAEKQLAPFLAEMKARGVRVYFDYTPYMYESTLDTDWKPGDDQFRSDLYRIGGTLLEKRDDLFFPITSFYHSNLHLNEDGRRVRTQKLIEALRGRI